MRKKLNSELLALMSEPGNPASLSLDSDFTFIQFEGTTKTGPSVQSQKIKESKITFNLPGGLKVRFENQLQRLKGNEELANQQIKDILEDDALAKNEWPLAIRQRLGSATASEQNAHITPYL